MNRAPSSPSAKQSRIYLSSTTPIESLPSLKVCRMKMSSLILTTRMGNYAETKFFSETLKERRSQSWLRLVDIRVIHLNRIDVRKVQRGINLTPYAKREVHK